MSDLGSDAGSTSLNIGIKILEALLKLMEKIFDTWQNAPERELNKYKAKQAKTEDEKREAIKKLDGKTGYVKHKMLAKTGEPLTVTGIYLTPEEVKQFNAICKREELLFSSVSNVQLKKDGEKAFVCIECRTSDLEKLKSVVDRLNDEKRLMESEKRISDILSKGEENLTLQDYADLRELAKQKEEHQRQYAQCLNGNTQETIIHNAFDESKLKQMDIGEALNRLTGRAIDKDQYSIIADAHDPSKIIKCHGHEEKDQTGKPYIKTEYEVYHGDKCVLKTHDGRFEGRPNDYWLKEKRNIEKVANFSGEYYKFVTEDEYKHWAEYVNEQNKEELSEMDKLPEEKDYNKCREDAFAKLEENNAEIKDGIVYDKETKKPLTEYIKDENITQEQKVRAAESIIVGKQLNNYNEIESLHHHIDYAKAQLIIAPPDSKEYIAIQKDIQDAKEQLATAYEQDKTYVDERKSINAVQSIQHTEQERQEQGQQEQQQNEYNDEHDIKQMTMEEVKIEIEKEKSNDKTKGEDIKDRQATEQIKASKSSQDRMD